MEIFKPMPRKLSQNAINSDSEHNMWSLNCAEKKISTAPTHFKTLFSDVITLSISNLTTTMFRFRPNVKVTS